MPGVHAPTAAQGLTGAHVSAIIIILSNSYRRELTAPATIGVAENIKILQKYIKLQRAYANEKQREKKREETGVNPALSSVQEYNGCALSLKRLGHDLELRDDLVEGLRAVHDVVARARVHGAGGALLFADNKNVVVPAAAHVSQPFTQQRAVGGRRYALLELRLSDLLGKLVVGDVHVHEEAAAMSRAPNAPRAGAAHPAPCMRSRTVLA